MLPRLEPTPTAATRRRCVLVSGIALVSHEFPLPQRILPYGTDITPVIKVFHFTLKRKNRTGQSGVLHQLL
jgi:hypothetical protein